MGFFKSFRERVRVGGGSLVALLHENVGGYQPRRYRYHVVHASDLTQDGWCAREHMLLGLTGTDPGGQYVNTSMQTTWDHGWMVERRIANDYLADVAFGTWKCRLCGRSEVRRGKPKGCADGCRGSYRYRSLSFGWMGVWGTIDLVVDIGNLFRPVEIKTMDKDQFRVLSAPLAEHRRRSELYLELLHVSAHNMGLGEYAKKLDTQAMTILYVSRSYGFKQDHGMSPFKEFKVGRTEEAAALLEKGVRVYRVRKGHVGLPDRICATAFCKRANACPVVKACFSAEWPPGKKVA